MPVNRRMSETGGSFLVVPTVACLLAIGAAPARAAIVHVFEGASIQAAIDGCASGDEIIVHPGTYNECIDFAGKAIWLHSADGPATTIIDAGDPDPPMSVVTCTGGEGPDTILQGFTVTGGTGTAITPWETAGGGMFIGNSGPTVHDCVFSLNAAYYGAGVYNADGACPVFTDCGFHDNPAYSGGGMYNAEGSDATVIGSSFNANDANYAGGMRNNLCDPIITNCTFIENVALMGGYGGGIQNSGAEPVVTGCDFIENWAGDEGGGISNSGGSPTIIDCTFTGNFSGDAGGGGIVNFSASPVIAHCTFELNTGPDGGGILNFSSDPIISACTFRNNTATYWSGGAMASSGGDPVVTNSYFCENTPEHIVGPWSDGGGNAFCPQCPGDVNGNGTVDVLDLLALLAAWGNTAGPADVNGDGIVDVQDLLELLAAWGPC